MADDWTSLDAKLERLAAMADVIEEELAPQICNLMRNTAIAMVTNVWGAVDTGALRNSIEGVQQLILREDDATVEMGITATSDHLRYVEFGTGAKGSATYTSPTTGESYTAEGVTFQADKAMWFQHNPDYQGVFGENNDPNGVNEWIPRFAQHPRPIMRPALYDNLPYVRDMMESAMTEGFE